MPVSKAQIRRARVVGHVVDFGDGVEVTFWYDRNKITDAWMHEWRAHEEQKAAPALNEMLADLIERWDVVEYDEGDVLPVTAGTIGELFSLPDKLMLMEQLMTASVPSRAEGEVSSAPSQAPSPDSTATSATRLNGQEPSASPKSSESLSPT